jgi:hypothetical protein
LAASSSVCSGGRSGISCGSAVVGSAVAGVIQPTACPSPSTLSPPFPPPGTVSALPDARVRGVPVFGGSGFRGPSRARARARPGTVPRGGDFGRSWRFRRRSPLTVGSTPPSPPAAPARPGEGATTAHRLPLTSVAGSAHGARFLFFSLFTPESGMNGAAANKAGCRRFRFCADAAGALDDGVRYDHTHPLRIEFPGFCGVCY